MKMIGGAIMQIVFDVSVDGKVKETLKPGLQRLKEIHAFIKEAAPALIEKYGTNVCVNRRQVYN
jgi:hypothetical protein